MNSFSLPLPRSMGARKSRTRKLCGAALLASWLLGIAPEGRAQMGDGGLDPAATSFQKPKRDYHDYQEICLLVDAWVAADPRVESIDLGESREGRSVPAFRFSSRRPEESSGLSIETRTVLIVGGIDGRSQAGCEAALWSAHGLLAGIDHLASDLSFVVVPWASPDALSRTHEGIDWSGRSMAPTDDDGDGSFAEDGPDDLDGDGLILDMAVPDPEHGKWCFAEDHRFLVPARPGDAPRYTLTREGRDDDRDGLFNEDGLGGVNFNAHFPVGWGSSADAPGRGPWPMSEGVPRRFADLALRENVVLCVSFAGAGGGVDFGRPSADSVEGGASSDAEHRIRLAFERTTGRIGCSSNVAEPPSGRAVDWIVSVLPCVAMDVAVWGPAVVGVDGRPFAPRLHRGGTGSGALDRSKEALDAGRPLCDSDAAWAFWLDDIRGGAGFQDWHPVDLGQGRVGWVGGWEPRTRYNPPADCLQGAIEGLPRFVYELVAGLPRLELEILSVERMGDLVQIDARVTNRGGLGTDLTHRKGAGEVTVELDRVDPASLVAGSMSTRFQKLGPSESSRTLRWMIQVKPGATVRIRARAATSPMVIREVRS
ncbi:Zinc carboxypeptidase [Planctomycetes bacterium Poly30]|uniref:Zinc carboxypeptidase n=1 Tax=Saltatorellus ferox TaxID=2528018 RepID=A0A518ES33_9BACT|nr:Zinc carboxypeptidase [Planctomycetes bacterium Poly30]